MVHQPRLIDIIHFYYYDVLVYNLYKKNVIQHYYINFVTVQNLINKYVSYFNKTNYIIINKIKYIIVSVLFF